MGRTTPDLTGQRFGLWTALHRDGHIYGKQAAWTCRCDCGTVRRVGASLLQRGESKCCGCANHKSLGDRVRKHGLINHRLYDTWTAMHDRCRRPSHIAYPRYGGRGIFVCPEWSDFSTFLADMEPAWREGLTLDRIDNNGPYAPANCHWATGNQQARNRSNTKRIEFRGEIRPIAEWAEIVGIKRTIVEMRLWRGWPIDRALTKPPRRW
jgi:hypothetical protein